MTEKAQQPGPQVSVRSEGAEDCHQTLAACRQESDDRLQALLPPNSVAEAHQKGYLLNERLIRPARVIISTPSVVGGQPDDQDDTGT